MKKTMMIKEILRNENLTRLEKVKNLYDIKDECDLFNKALIDLEISRLLRIDNEILRKKMKWEMEVTDEERLFIENWDIL